MIRGKFEIMDGIRLATNTGSMDFKSGCELHRESQRYAKRKNMEKKNAKSKVKSKLDLLATIDKMEKERTAALDVLSKAMEKMDRMAALNKKLAAK